MENIETVVRYIENSSKTENSRTGNIYVEKVGFFGEKIIHIENTGLCSRKRDKYSPGISLTTQTQFIFRLFFKFILQAQNDE